MEALAGLVERVTFHNADRLLRAAPQGARPARFGDHGGARRLHQPGRVGADERYLGERLLYTGVARGERLVVLVGQRCALAIAVRNQGARRRWCRLREWLRA